MNPGSGDMFLVLWGAAEHIHVSTYLVLLGRTTLTGGDIYSIRGICSRLVSLPSVCQFVYLPDPPRLVSNRL